MPRSRERIGISDLDVRNVISYYSLLRTKPAGKYHVQVCTNISCMLRGGNEILEHCKKKLGIGHKERDGGRSLFSRRSRVHRGVLLGAGLQVNYDFHDNLTAESMAMRMLSQPS